MYDAMKKSQNVLIETAKEKGFIRFDDIFNISQEFNLSISDIDYLTSSLQEKKIIILDDTDFR